MQQEVHNRYAAFFVALFQQLLISFQDIEKAKMKVSIVSRFHHLMTQNPTYAAPNAYRKKFYWRVCQQAELVSNGIYTIIRYSYRTPRQLFNSLNQQEDEPMIGVEFTSGLGSPENDPTIEVDPPIIGFGARYIMLSFPQSN